MNENHLKNKKHLKLIGLILIIFGVISTAVGLFDFFVSFTNPSRFPSLFFLVMLGGPVLVIGIFMLSLGYRREISTYMKNETVPVINEVSSELKLTITNISSAIKNGIDNDKITCLKCHEINDNNANFCTKCGSKLINYCPYCGHDIKEDANFCLDCGKKLK